MGQPPRLAQPKDQADPSNFNPLEAIAEEDRTLECSPTRAHSVRAWHSVRPGVSPFAPRDGFLPASLHSSGRHLPTAPIEANAWQRPFALPQWLFLWGTPSAESKFLTCRFGVPPNHQATRSAFGLLPPTPGRLRCGWNHRPRPVAACLIRLPRTILGPPLPFGVLPPRDRCAQPDSSPRSLLLRKARSSFAPRPRCF
jgi:hypothetical protein